jgi:hypothetical protein
MSYIQDMEAGAKDLLVEAAALLLEAAKGSLFITSLNKGLFYADLRAMLTTGSAITGTTYLALPAGPVIARYQRRVIGALADAGLAEQDDTDAKGKPLYLIGKPERKLVSAEHAKIIQRAADWAKARSTSALSKYSHKNPGWTAAYEAGLKAGRSAQPINMRIAMQQIMDDDPWMSEEPDPKVEAALVDVDEEVGTAW